MPDFDVISLLECKKRKVRSHGKRKKTATLCAKFDLCRKKRIHTSLKGLSVVLNNHGRHGLLSFLVLYLFRFYVI